MGRRLRLWEQGSVFSGVWSCVDRQFLLRPNHNRKAPLLHESCPTNALEPKNRIVPAPSIINIIGSSVGRALEQHPVQLHWFDANINHIHVGFSLGHEQIEHASEFLRDAGSLIARQINSTWEREGHFFAAPMRLEACVDDASAEKKLLYALTNPVKDGQIDSVSQSPFFSTFRHLANGEPLRFWYIDWDGYWLAGGPRNRKCCPKDFLRWSRFELTPLPAWSSFTTHQRQTRIRHLVREIEESEREARRREKRTVVGVQALFALDPRQRPTTPRDTGPQPLCHASDPELRREYERKWRDFIDEHRKASADYRAGDHEREFPEGSFRPPLIKIYTSSRL